MFPTKADCLPHATVKRNGHSQREFDLVFALTRLTSVEMSRFGSHVLHNLQQLTTEGEEWTPDDFLAAVWTWADDRHIGFAKTAEQPDLSGLQALKHVMLRLNFEDMMAFAGWVHAYAEQYNSFDRDSVGDTARNILAFFQDGNEK